jgi:hypothetical protein
VPYGTLLCVSDKPLHGELKLPGQANRFYERAIAEHMKIGIQTCEELRWKAPSCTAASSARSTSRRLGKSAATGPGATCAGRLYCGYAPIHCKTALARSFESSTIMDWKNQPR